MMSARHWKDRRPFWQALIFWVWLASFVFGFAASDLFHAANCPDQWALRASSHGASVAQLSHAHASQLDVSCPTCLLQLGAQGILALALIFSAPLFAARFRARPRPVYTIARALIYGARGPPVSAI